MRLRIDQDGSESAELSANGGFIVVQVPVVVLGEAPKGGAGFRFTIGSFQGRETRLLFGTKAPGRLTFRIPKELFRARERLSLEAIARDEQGSENILWAKRYEAGWLGSIPHVEPIADYLDEAPEGAIRI